MTVREVAGTVYGAWSHGAVAGTIHDLTLLPPCEPTTVAALAYNYKDLVGPRETYDEPLVFVKSPACVIGSRDPIARPSWVDRVWVEVEVGVVIRTAVFEATREQAAAAILGYTVTNDVTAVNVHGRDHHLARSKSLATFCPVGDVVHTDVDTRRLSLVTTINGRVTQRGSTSDRIYDDVEAVMLVSRLLPLAAGDIILTGTPAGAMDSLVQPGDAVELAIEGLGRLTNGIVARGLA
jgi:2-keto-4-pentenoate hydratase/2-oxohepta-3-ene-1,7-dioic acid hydratase in catechol pathway